MNDLATPAVKFKQIAKIPITANMRLEENSIIKNNANEECFNGKLFFLAERFKNAEDAQARSQLDLLVQKYI